MSFQVQITDYALIKNASDKYIDVNGVDKGSSIPEGYVVDLVTLTEAKNYIKQEYGSIATEDQFIIEMIQASRQWVENYINQSITKKEIVAFTDDELGEFRLPYRPVTKITEVVRINLEGEETELIKNTDYYEIGLTDKTLVFYHTWTTGTSTAFIAIKATYTAAMTSVPRPIKMAILDIVAENYYHRGESTHETIQSVPFDVRRRLKPFKVVII
jgi:uncharacterized phiE125 gp8 family phage protein